MPGIPVVISTNGFGTPVKVVTSNAPLMTVAENGYGMPIVLSDNGAPFVVRQNGRQRYSVLAAYRMTHHPRPMAALLSS